MSRMEVKLKKPPQMSHTCGTSKPCQSAQTSDIYIYIFFFFLMLFQLYITSFVLLIVSLSTEAEMNEREKMLN